MSRYGFLPALALGFLLSGPLPAQEDDGPPVSITSPDRATTFAYGSIKDRVLIWSRKEQVLIARVTFTDAEQSNGSSNDDTHDFKLPGVTFDEAKGLFSATSRKGVIIPVAHVKKALFFKTIEVLPNAAVRILRDRGNVTVILEAIGPDDPAMHPAPTDPDGAHKVDADKIVPGL
jgi:hypothetical protein